MQASPFSQNASSTVNVADASSSLCQASDNGLMRHMLYLTELRMRLGKPRWEHWHRGSTHEGLEVVRRTLMSNRADQPEVAKSDTFGRPSRSRSVRRVRRNDILTARDLSVICTEGHWVIVQCRACPCFRKAILQYNARAARNVQMPAVCPMCSMSRSAPHHIAVSKRVHGPERERNGRSGLVCRAE